MKRGGPKHPKMQDLAARLGVDRAFAVGIIENLSHFAAAYARRGDVGKYTDDAIARDLCDSIEGKTLIPALVEGGWLDECACHRLRIHDWPEHADQGVQRSPEVKAGGFLECYGSKLENSSGTLVTDSRIGRAYGGRRTADGGRRTEQGGRLASEPPPTAATPAEASAVALAHLGPPPARPERTEKPNPLVAGRRPEMESQALQYVSHLAALVDAHPADGELVKLVGGEDPVEIMANAARYEGALRQKVNPAQMSDDRLANTWSDLRATVKAVDAYVARRYPPAARPP